MKAYGTSDYLELFGLLMLVRSLLAWSRLWSNHEMIRQRSWLRLRATRTRQVQSVWVSWKAGITIILLLGHASWFLYRAIHQLPDILYFTTSTFSPQQERTIFWYTQTWLNTMGDRQIYAVDGVNDAGWMWQVVIQVVWSWSLLSCYSLVSHKIPLTVGRCLLLAGIAERNDYFDERPPYQTMQENLSGKLDKISTADLFKYLAVPPLARSFRPARDSHTSG